MSALTKWSRPESYEDIKPYDVEAANEKIPSDRVEKARRLNEQKERIAHSEPWDALEE